LLIKSDSLISFNEFFPIINRIIKSLT
jgi:hypothetical protein